MNNPLSTIAGAIFFVGFLPYMRAIFRKETQPAKASWLVWAGLDVVNLVSMHLKGALNGQIIGAVIGSGVIVVLALKYGVPGWGLLDKICLVGGALGVILSLIFRDSIFGIVLSSAMTFVAAFPTFKTAWIDYTKEDRLAWTIFWVSCVLTLIALSEWTLAEASQPISYFVIETIMMFLLCVRPWWVQRRAT